MRRLNPEISLGFLVASLFWIGVLGWQPSYSLTEKQKADCYEAAKKTGYKNEECKNFWERTTSDPIALFNLILALSTVGLWTATISLYRAGEKQTGLARDDFNATHRPWIPVTKVTLNFGLKWAQGNAVVGLNVFCKNAGNSPAQRVSLAAAIFPFLYNEDIPREMAKLQKAHAASTERPLIEYTLFPGMPDELCLTRMLLIPESDLSALKDRFGEPATEMVPVILGSIEYYFPFGERSPHHTPFVYFLWGTSNGTDRLTFKLNGKNVEPDNMILVDIVSAGDPT